MPPLEPPANKDIDWNLLFVEAKKALEYSYSPYSNYKVGASLLTTTGKIYTGCNIECSSYTPTVCAERVAIFKAVSEGERQFKALAVITVNSGFPCGVCRQVLREFAVDIPIYVGDMVGNYQIVSSASLLPHSFGPEMLA